MKLNLTSTPKQGSTPIQMTTTAAPASVTSSPIITSTPATPSSDVLSPLSFKICTPTSFSVASTATSTTPSIFSGAVAKSVFGGEYIEKNFLEVMDLWKRDWFYVKTRVIILLILM